MYACQVWTYANEDWVGRLSAIGMSCRFSTQAARRSKQIMDKWIYGFCVRLKHAGYLD